MARERSFDMDDLMAMLRDPQAAKMMELALLAFGKNTAGQPELLESGRRLLDHELSLLKGDKMLSGAIFGLKYVAQDLRCEGADRAARALERLIKQHVDGRVALGDGAAARALDNADAAVNKMRRFSGQRVTRRAPQYTAKTPSGSVRASLMRIPSRFY